MRRYAARADGNQPAIVEALRKAGAAVQPLHTVGGGIPDLLVTHGGRTFLIEVKDPGKPKNDQKLTPAQVKWHAAWPGEIYIVRTVDEALLALFVAETA